jgi:transcriptional regulator with GAF, ATPase, and Fis domain
MLILQANGKKRYDQGHAEFLSAVADPFALALANTLSYQEVLRYRDILLDDNRFLNRELFFQAGDEIIGGNSGLRNVMEMVRQVAPLNNTVLLMGETGTGKEIIANTILFTSPRKDGPLIKVNCGAIPESLIDSELFGHEKGAFTGAISEKRGRFERANSGTIFLDEIGELPLQAQVRRRVEIWGLLFAPGALERLMNYGWPRNVRELENLVERELIRHRGGQLRFDSLLPSDISSETRPVIEVNYDGPLNLDEAMALQISKVLKLDMGRVERRNCSVSIQTP